ncbi:MAG: hypothetical protein AAFY43_01710 [Pseudomonadota bacterium]
MTQPPDWYGQALWRICALIVVFLSMAGVAAAQDHSQSGQAGGDELHLQWQRGEVLIVPLEELQMF